MDNGEYLKEMGERIREIREGRGLYITEMHKMIGYTPSAITDIEKGRSNAHLLTLKAIADVLKCDVKDFL